MSEKKRVQIFDDWADRYDQSLKDSQGFPFDGYEQVLNEISRLAGAHSGMQVLDLGIGTGNLAERFASLGCELWGIDFSAEMLAQTKEKLPQAILVQGDLLGNWPAELDRRFDRIVSAYVLHEFDLPIRMKLLERLGNSHLAAGGRIVIGDIAFPSARARDQAHRYWAAVWDEEEQYWAAEEAAVACQAAGLLLTYQQVSSCGGVFVFEPESQG